MSPLFTPRLASNWEAEQAAAEQRKAYLDQLRAHAERAQSLELIFYGVLLAIAACCA